MPINAYSLCPGGTGKKIKFCCPDLVPELEKIDRMIEGNQHLACLKHIERLQEKHPDRACLLAIKALLLHAANQVEEALANAEMFVRAHPHSAIAQAELAMAKAIQQGGCEAVVPLHRALARSDGRIAARVYEVIGTVADSLLGEGEILAGRALLQLQAVLAEDDRRPVSVLIELNQSESVPLLLKNDPSIPPCPDDAPWKERFEEAMAPAGQIKWLAAEEKLAALADQVSDSPTIWRNLASVRGWLADGSGCAEALRKYASLDVPLEDAVEAEATAMLLSDDPLGDSADVLKVTWTVKDVDQLLAAMALDSRTVQVPLDAPIPTGDDSPPPKAAYMLLDRPVAETAEDVSLESVSRLLGTIMVYSRQTDREAQLALLGAESENLEQIQALIEELGGDALEPGCQTEPLYRVPASHESLDSRWRPPQDATPEQIGTLHDEHLRTVLLNQWPQRSLGIFNGKSPRQVAGDPSCRIRLLAAIMLLEYWAQRVPGNFDFNQLRGELGLPALEPIDPQPTQIGTLPLTRLSRVTVEKLSDEDLAMGFRRAVAFGAREARGRFARAMVDRPSLAGREEQLMAFSVLAQQEQDPEQVLQNIERGREAGRAAGQSCASWDFLELSHRLARAQGAEALQLIQHMHASHMEEPGVAERLTNLLVQIGLLRPDGTPAGPPMPGEPAAMPGGPPEPEPGKIWTPDNQEGGSGGGKIWTPD